ncbi:hypothetical protein WJX72_010725 [[Myrmecia] bisecta]|uniref:Ubiquitin-like domain-containing protein n=1 Tax=[Myrmecia] bisecta TaxID=41462 RepID=A0AAW1RA06_9CHLO
MGDVPQPQPIPDSEEVEINIKNPARSSAPEFKVKVPVSATVADLKARLQRDYTGNPHPSLQTIIYAGRVLKEDSVVLRQILTQGLEGAQCVHSMHLVPAAGSSGPSAQAAPAYTQFGAFPMFGSAAYQQPHAVAFQGQQQGPAYVRYQSNPYVQNPAMTAAYNAALAALQNANFFANPYAAAPGFAYLPYGWVPQGGQVVPVATLPYGFYPVPQQLPFGMPMQLQMQMQLPYAVHAAHAMQTGQGAPVPPPGAQQGLRRRLWGTAQPAAQNGAPAPAAVAARVRGPVRVHMIRINLRVLLQLLVVCVILWQHVPPNRFLFLLAVGAALYLLAFSPLRHVLQRFTGLLPPVNPPPPAPAGPAAAAPAGAAANGAPQQPAPAHAAAAARGAAPFGFVREIYAIIVGFFTSLLPGWNLNAEDAAAFAAAQQMVAREEAAAAAADAGNNNAADAPAAQAAAVGDADRPHQE